MATLFMSLLHNDKDGWRKKLTAIYEIVILCTWCCQNVLLLRSLFGEHLHNIQIFLHSLPICRGLYIYLFSKHLCHQLCFLEVLNHSARLLATAHESCKHKSGQFSFQAKYATRYTAWISAHCEYFPSPLLFRHVLLKGCSAATTCGWCLHNMPNHLNPKSSLLFLWQLITWYTPMRL